MPKLKSTSKPSKSMSIHTTTITMTLLLLFASFFLLICILLEYQLTIHEIILTYYYIQHEQISDPQIIHEQKLITQDTCKSICQRIPKISKNQLKSHGNISEMLSPIFNANLQILSNLSYPHLSGGAWIYKVKEDNEGESEDDEDNNTDATEDRYCDVLPEDGVAIIIPFPPNQAAERQQLYATLSTLIPLLQRQRLCYRIFVIESLSYVNSDDNNNSNNYNKGKLLNVGFVEAMKLFQFHCVVFHDFNLAPVNYYNSYQCDTMTKYSMIHLSMAINDNNNNLSKFKPPYTSSYRNNGVVKLTAKNFITVNGYSNVYWNAYNDIEYHYDFIRRLKTINVEYRHVNEKIGQYMLTSSSNKWENTPQLNGNNDNNNMNINHLQVTESTESRMNYDGLNNLAYKVISRLEEPFFTYISVLI